MCVNALHLLLILMHLLIIQFQVYKRVIIYTFKRKIKTFFTQMNEMEKKIKLFSNFSCRIQNKLRFYLIDIKFSYINKTSCRRRNDTKKIIKCLNWHKMNQNSIHFKMFVRASASFFSISSH